MRSSCRGVCYFRRCPRGIKYALYCILVSADRGFHSENRSRYIVNENPMFSGMQRLRWLTMVELESSALARQCLNRWITAEPLLRSEVLARAKKQNQATITVKGPFCIEAARHNHKRHCESFKALRSNPFMVREPLNTLPTKPAQGMNPA
jgi:hypothetical protein